MVQQTKDSKFSEYSLAANTETGLSNPDKKQPSLPIAAKKTVLQDLQNENTMVSKSSNLLPIESGHTGESVKVIGAKRSSTECLVTPSLPQCQQSNAGNNGRLVYVRRKPETELGRTSASCNQSNTVLSSQSRNTDDQDEATEKKLQLNEPASSTPEVSLPSTVGFPSARPSGSSSLEKSNYNISAANLTHPFAHHVLNNPIKRNIEHLEESYCRLQSILRKLDQSDQKDYMQMLRSLSSVDLSRHAVELEKRSIQLSLEEAKELQRVRILDILEKYTKHSSPAIHIAKVRSKGIVESLL